MKNQFQDSGLGGIIAIDKDGNFGKAFTTDMMGWASIKDDRMDDGLDKKMEIQDVVDDNLVLPFFLTIACRRENEIKVFIQ